MEGLPQALPWFVGTGCRQIAPGERIWDPELMGLGWARQRGAVGFAGSPLLCPDVTPGSRGWGFPVPRGGSGSPWGEVWQSGAPTRRAARVCARPRSSFFIGALQYRCSSPFSKHVKSS